MTSRAAAPDGPSNSCCTPSGFSRIHFSKAIPLASGALRKSEYLNARHVAVSQLGEAAPLDVLLAQDGRLEAAQAEMERAIWAYPRDYPSADHLLRELAVRDPTRFNALLKFTVRKHEEYLSAVHP